MNKLSPSDFTWERSSIYRCYGLNDFFKLEMGEAFLINRDKYKLMGYVEGGSIPVRPRPRDLAILFEIVDKEEVEGQIDNLVWLHFPTVWKQCLDDELKKANKNV